MISLADIKRDKTGKLLLSNYFAYPIFLRYRQKEEITVNYLMADVLSDINPFDCRSVRSIVKIFK